MADILGSLEVTHIIEILDNKIILVIEILRIEKKTFGDTSFDLRALKAGKN